MLTHITAAEAALEISVSGASKRLHCDLTCITSCMHCAAYESMARKHGLHAAGCLAAAAVAGGTLPPKLNAIIQPLMSSLRREAESLLQSASATAVARMLQLAAQRTPCPNDKCAHQGQVSGSYIFSDVCPESMLATTLAACSAGS